MSRLGKVWQVLSALPEAALGRAIAHTYGESGESELAAWATLLCAHLQEGRVFLDVQQPFKGLEVAAAGLEWSQDVPGWVAVAEEGGQPAGEGPLVYVRQAGQLWLARYYDFDCRLRRLIGSRRQRVARVLDEKTLRRDLRSLFPQGVGEDSRDLGQLIAAANLVDLSFGLLTGGPGTGKTTSIAKMLVLFARQAGRAGLKPVLLLAPTGKAAARLKESLVERIRELRALSAEDGTLTRLLDMLDPENDDSLIRTSTIHRALGVRASRGGGQGPFRHDSGNPLEASIVIVDEVSMVDLALMTRLVEAVPEETPLVLVGDAEQLESVEAGSVLPGIIKEKMHVQPERLALISGRTGLEAGWISSENLHCADHVRLTYNHRFVTGSPVVPLAKAINAGDADEFLRLMESGEAKSRGCRWVRLPESGQAQPAGLEEIMTGPTCYGPLRAVLEAGGCAEPGVAVERFDGFRVLCAIRQGPDGTGRWNERLQKWVAGAAPERPRAVMVTVNDASSGLCNGDTGLVLPTADGSAVFYSSAGISWPASMLPENEPGWAITIHKSQGSEYNTVAVVLPRDGGLRLMSRRLLYTAVTRAKDTVIIVATEKALRTAIEGGGGVSPD